MKILIVAWAIISLMSVLPLQAVSAVAPEIERIFRPARHSRGNTNILRLQPIDEASWVWKGDAPKTCFLKFEKEFEVKEGDDDLVIDVSSDERFVLMLDDIIIARGPNRGTVENWQYQSYRISKLSPGRHKIAAIAWTLC